MKSAVRRSVARASSSSMRCACPTSGPKLRTPAIPKATQNRRRTCSSVVNAAASGGHTAIRSQAEASTATRPTASPIAIARNTRPSRRRWAISSGPMLHAPARYSPRPSLTTIAIWSRLPRISMSLRMLRAMRAWIGCSRLRAAALIATFVILAVPGSVLAHAELQRSIPDDGETVTDPVTLVTATYSQDLAANSRLLVKDASGATVATGVVDPNNVRRMIARPATPLGNGAYDVQSTSVSADDGDIERVQWTFTVA